ncbi:MAG TPA: hypothetical protein VLG48_07605 [Candidatus Methylomirabilis sp.]|nr:hypothetical protein [Candidatus Methylomirabilis sp.]
MFLEESGRQIRPTGEAWARWPRTCATHWNRDGGWTTALVQGLLSVGLLVAAASAWCATPPSPVIDEGVRAAVRQGSARVIVELRIPGIKPEGDLASSAAVAAQRRAISDAQASVVARLAGTWFSLLRQYRSVPFLALEVGPDALNALEHMADVVSRVLEDRMVLPRTGTGTPSERPHETP